MNSKEIAQELNEINKNTGDKILNQIFSLLIIGFTIGFPQELLKRVRILANTISKIDEPNRQQTKRNTQIIPQLTRLYNKTSDIQSKMLIGVFITSIGFNKLIEYRNILVHLNPQLQKFIFETEISPDGKTFH